MALWSAWDALHHHPPATLYHYTTADGLLGIFQSRQLWATNVRFMNDTSELAYAFDLIRSVFGELAHGISRRRNPKMLRALESSERALMDMLNDAEHDTKHFAVSFCEDGNLLSQWRGYGQLGNGFALGLSTPHLGAFAAQLLPHLPIDSQRLAVFLRKALYDPVQQRTLLSNWLHAAVDLLSRRRVPLLTPADGHA